MDNKKAKNNTTKTYLHPNHVRKSKTEFEFALLNRLAQTHKLDIKFGFHFNLMKLDPKT